MSASAEPISRFEKVFGAYRGKGNKKLDLLGGLVTFLAMCYILPVNASILSQSGMDPLGVFASTALVSGIATLLMSMLGKAPIALSAGMGLNAFFTYTVCGMLGFCWQEGMILLTVSGVIFLIMSLTKVRLFIVNSFPKDVKHAISAGLGAFLAFIGLKGAGIIADSESTLVTLGDLSQPSVILSVAGIFFVFFLSNLKTKSKLFSYLSLPISMLLLALFGYFMTLGGVNDPMLPNVDWGANWGIVNYEKVFMYGVFDPANSGMDFPAMLADVFSNPLSYAALISLLLVNLFDTTATLLACGAEAEILDEKGNLQSNGPVLADAIGSAICAPLGTSTVTSFAESSVGIKTGARTGFASLLTGTLFILSAFLYPVFELFSSSCVSSAALVSVGGLIFASNMRKIDFSEVENGFCAFLSVLMIVLTYSLTSGIAFGLLSYVVIAVARGKAKKLGWMVYLVACLLLASLVITAVV